MTTEIRGMVRFFRSNLWLALISGLTVLALAAALWSIRGLGLSNADRERDRVASDVSGCQRGNANRQVGADQIRDVVRSLVAASDNPQNVDAVLTIIEPVLARTPITDCSTVIPGANPDTPDFPPPEAP